MDESGRRLVNSPTNSHITHLTDKLSIIGYDDGIIYNEVGLRLIVLIFI